MPSCFGVSSQDIVDYERDTMKNNPTFGPKILSIKLGHSINTELIMIGHIEIISILALSSIILDFNLSTYD